MKLYFIECEVSIKVFGISGPFVQTVTKLVRATSSYEARVRYETHIREMFAHMQGESFEFKYLVVADEI